MYKCVHGYMNACLNTLILISWEILSLLLLQGEKGRLASDAFSSLFTIDAAKKKKYATFKWFWLYMFFLTTKSILLSLTGVVE
jgi:preprotein translocase subunit SecG